MIIVDVLTWAVLVPMLTRGVTPEKAAWAHRMFYNFISYNTVRNVWVQSAAACVTSEGCPYVLMSAVMLETSAKQCTKPLGQLTR